MLCPLAGFSLRAPSVLGGPGRGGRVFLQRRSWAPWPCAPGLCCTVWWGDARIQLHGCLLGIASASFSKMGTMSVDSRDAGRVWHPHAVPQAEGGVTSTRISSSEPSCIRTPELYGVEENRQEAGRGRVGTERGGGRPAVSLHSTNP